MLEGMQKQVHPGNKNEQVSQEKAKHSELMVSSPSPKTQTRPFTPLLCGFNTLHLTYHKHITCFQGPKQFLPPNRVMWSGDPGHPRLEPRLPRPQLQGLARKHRPDKGPWTQLVKEESGQRWQSCVHIWLLAHNPGLQCFIRCFSFYRWDLFPYSPPVHLMLWRESLLTTTLFSNLKSSACSLGSELGKAQRDSQSHRKSLDSWNPSTSKERLWSVLILVSKEQG